MFAVLRRVKAEVRQDNATLLAAGVAFYAMLAIFPAIIAVVTIYGMVADPAQVESQVGEFAKSLPAGADQLLTTQLESVTSAGRQSLSIGLVVSLLAVLRTASGGVQGLVKGLNLVYDEQESRGFLKPRGLSLLITLGSILMAVVVIALAVLYRYAPDRANPRWRWVSWGTVVALVLWLLGSIGFSWHVDNFGTYNQTYGALAAVIILLLWLFPLSESQQRR
jgi:membrane protein